MWYYASPDQISARFSSTPAFGFLIDYWFFVTADEQIYPLRCRPIGINDIMAMTSWSTKQSNVKKLLPIELGRYGRTIAASIREAAPDSPVLTDGEVSAEWMHFLHSELGDKYGAKALCEALFYRAQDHASRREFADASRCLRALAAEMGSLVRSDVDLFLAGKRLLLDRRWDFETFFGGVYGESELAPYEVCFSISPADVPSRLTRRAWGVGVDLVFDAGLASKDGDRERALTEIRISVVANSKLNAVNNAEVEARVVLSKLRSQFYLRTHFVGPIRVRQASVMTPSSKPSDASEDWSYFAYRRPFWSARGASTRRPPVMPVNLKRSLEGISEKHQQAWQAMRWHVSQALAVWPEDVHTAASQIWQGIEVLGRSLTHKKGGMDAALAVISLGFEKEAVDQLYSGLRNKINSQIGALKRNKIQCDWWLPDDETGIDWGLSLSNYGDIPVNKSEKWTRPERPRIYFDRKVGIFSKCGRDISEILPFKANQHFKSNLHILYAIRNSLVHSGAREISPRVANYLAGFGLELLCFVGYNINQNRHGLPGLNAVNLVP